MHGIRIIFGITLLLLIGCRLTTPTVPPFEDIDPFRNALAPDFPPPPIQPSLIPVVEPDEAGDEPAPPLPLEDESLVEPLVEPDDDPPLSETEQIELLSENQWVKNIALINWLDSGRKRTVSESSPADRQRRDAMNLLNMSNAERTKRQNQKFDYIDGIVSDWRWMHRGVDQLHTMPPSQRVSPDVFLREQKYKNQKILQANAAILMGRDGNSDVGPLLLSIAQNNSIHVRIRCAAVEVLGRMATVTVDDLTPLLETVKDRKIETTHRQTGEQVQQYHPGLTEVWEELLLAIAEKIDPWEHECFIEPFYSPLSDIRLVAAKIWRKQSLQKRTKGALPEKFLEIAKRENNPSVRVEIIKTLGAWQVPDLFAFLENDLRHRTAEIRNAAMIALADAGCQEAIPLVKDQLRDSFAPNRAAAIAALRKLGAFDEVFKFVGDSDYRVRVEVAKAFSERCTPPTATFARSYLSDHKDVQSATIEAVGGWSIEESGPLLLLAAKSQASDVRCRAVELLAQKGIAYSGFDPGALPVNQKDEYEALVQVFRESVGIDPILDGNRKERTAANTAEIRQVSMMPEPPTLPEDTMLHEVRKCLADWSDKTLPPDQRPLIQRRLAAHGQRLMPMIDLLMTVEKCNIPESLDRVFAEVEPMFGEIEKLRSDDLLVKRRAANELARLGTVNSPPKLAAKRMVDLAAKQDDTEVLVSILNALKNADPDLVCRLARPLLQSESAKVRRVSCEMLQRFGSGEDVALLKEALNDSSQGVVRGALLAIDTLLESADAADPSVVETLKAKLLQGDSAMQTDVAATLHRLGCAEGTDALRRLAASPDHQTKMYVAQSVSALDDPAFVPLLLRFLEDGNGSVRSEALRGLPKLTGEDIGRGGSTQEQIDRWKRWGKEQRQNNGTASARQNRI